ncbi:MAG: hypothetical protein JXB10_00615 [Pirellulales bacterium]|nr:hypothetical protein [Pirellulales bacterium]
MVWKTKSTQTKPSRSNGTGNGHFEPPPEIVDFLIKVRTFLAEGRYKDAVEMISHSKHKSLWHTNANGVCLLRMNRAHDAVSLFRGLLFSANGIMLREDMPIVFKTNFATALLASGNFEGCLSILQEINDESNARVQQLRGAIQRFRASLSLLKRWQWRMGFYFPSGPIAMDFPLGELM